MNKGSHMLLNLQITWWQRRDNFCTRNVLAKELDAKPEVATLLIVTVEDG